MHRASTFGQRGRQFSDLRSDRRANEFLKQRFFVRKVKMYAPLRHTCPPGNVFNSRCGKPVSEEFLKRGLKNGLAFCGAPFGPRL